MVHRYLDEVSGDATATWSICREYDLLVYKDEHAHAQQEYRSGNLSTERIQHHFALAKNDPQFEAFHNLVEEACESTVHDCYGMFTPLTLPILTESTIQMMAATFQE